MSRPSIPALLASSAPSFSFEFFPPKDDAAEDALWHAIRRLERVNPAFVSVTYGAGGSTRDRTVRVTERIAHETTMRPMAHLTCVSSSIDELRSVIGSYAAGGVRDVLALRGDPPGGPGTPWSPHPQGLDHAEDLVRLVRSLGDFTVGVAAFPDKHPEASDLEADARVLARKFDAGAQFAVTQFVFDVASYARLRDLLASWGYDAAIVPGLMPVTSFKQVARMAQLSGTPLPGAVVDRLAPLEGEPAALRAEGVAIATELAQDLLAQGAPGLHFYTMNRSTASLQVYRNLVGALPGGVLLGEDDELPEAAAQGLLRGGAVAAVRRALDAADAGEWDAVAGMLAPDVEFSLPGGGVGHTGVGECLGWASSCWRPGRIVRIVYDGARQVVVWRALGQEQRVAFVTLDELGRITDVQGVIGRR